MILGSCVYTPINCVYQGENLDNISVDDFKDLITGYVDNDYMRDELQGQPRLKGYAGPMFNGYGTYKGEKVAIIRYEK